MVSFIPGCNPWGANLSNHIEVVMFNKLAMKLAALFGLVASGSAMAAALDTTQLSDITTSLNTASSWLSGNVTTAIVAIIVAVIIISIVKFAGKKAKP